jgi:hypothetical protein
MTGIPSLRLYPENGTGRSDVTETEPIAPHIDGLAYSREDEPTVVDYPEDPETILLPVIRSWYHVGATAFGMIALTMLLVTAASIWGPVQTAPPNVSVTPQTPTPSTVTVTPSEVPPPKAQPAPPSQPPPVKRPPVRHVDPDIAFTKSWNEQMPALPFSDQYCVDNGARQGCWMQLTSSDPDNVEFIFLGRGRCEYIRSHPGSSALAEAARDIRRTYSDVTTDQSNEIVALAVHAYCPNA